MTKRFLTITIALLARLWLIAQHNCPSTGGGPNFAGLNLTDFNFTALPVDTLIGANFTNAILNGAQFQNVNLTNANFSGAILRRSEKGFTDLSGAMLDHTCFQNAQLDSANMQFAIFKATDLTAASLLATDFGLEMIIQPSGDTLRTRFNNTTTDYNHFPINNWTAVNWANIDLSNARISGLNSKDFSFKGDTISFAILKGFNFTNFDFSSCTMVGVDLTGAKLDFAQMENSVMDRAILVNASLKNTQMTGARFYNPAVTGQGVDFSGAVLKNANLHGCNFSFAQMQGASLTGALADSCTFDNANFESEGNLDVANFTGADLSNSSFIGAQLNGVNFSNTFLTNGQFNNLTLMGTNFSGATMPGANFQSSILEGVLFTGAILQNASFVSATMKTPPEGGSGVDFSCSQLGGANFSNAEVTEASFADAVMLPGDSCCSKIDGIFCGFIAINQLGYGATIFPVLKNSVTCPNGDRDTCRGQQWVVPHWRTENCNTSHQEETVWFKPNCGAQDTTGKITFPDLNLEACIIDQLFGGDNSKIITKNIAAQVATLHCPARGISNPQGLQFFTGLQQLDLSANKLADASFLATLKELHTLHLNDNQLVTLNLDGLPLINFLEAPNNHLSTLTLDADADLIFLNLSNNNLSQAGDPQFGIGLQTALDYVDLSNNKLTTIGDLSNLMNANTIFLENNSLKTIGDISKIYKNGQWNLQYMNLSCNPAFECSTLELDSIPLETDFLHSTQCGVNNLPGCGTNSKTKTQRTPAAHPQAVIKSSTTIKHNKSHGKIKKTKRICKKRKY